MIFKLLSIIALISIFIGFRCSFAENSQQSFILGNWAGRIQNETMIDNKKAIYTILVNLSFKENGVVEIEEVHLSDLNKNQKMSKNFKFLKDQKIEISGFEEKFVVNSNGQNEMFLDLTDDYRWKENIPIIATVKFKRIE